MFKLHFLGANRQVTGSRTLVEAAGRRILVDYGLVQERRYLERNWAPCPIPADEVDDLLLTHAHLDHVGLLPRLVSEGFRGRILATPPSLDLARIVLEDSARIQEEDVAYKRRRHKREGRRGPHPAVPLYTREDVEATLRLFRQVHYDRPLALSNGLEVCYRDAGHIIGSALLELRVRDGGRQRRIVFSGDIGESDRPLLEDPTLVSEADVVVMESTYGDRDHRDEGDVADVLAQVIRETIERGGNLVVPTFAIDRAQALMYHLGCLAHDGRIPRITVFLDSPMAINATTVYKRYRNLFDDDAQALLRSGRHPFQFRGLHFTRGAEESKAINSIKGSCVILAGSGMCTGGRVKHHLRRNLDRPESTILFTGYQAAGTLGRLILEGREEVRIHGRKYPVRARIERLHGLSAHADRTGLLHWLSGFGKTPDHVFLNHGDERAAEALAERIETEHGRKPQIPEYGTEWEG